MDLIEIGLYVLYFIFTATIATALLLPLLSLFRNPKALVSAAIVAAGFLAIFFLCYSISGGDLTQKYVAAGVTESQIKLIGAGVIMLYIFMIGSIVVMLYSEVSKLFK